MKKYYANNFSSVQAAINAAVMEVDGSDFPELIFPAGCYETGPLELHSDMVITLDKGATIKFIADPNLYPAVWTRWEGIECYAMHPLLFAQDCCNITIRGKGVIDGSGTWWWDTFRQIEAEDRTEPSTHYEKALAKLNPDYKTRPGGGARPQTQFLRPPLVQFWQCQHVILQDITLQNSPFWTLHFVYSQEITIASLKIINPADAINTDAIDIDSSQNVMIEDCLFDVGDDAITLKSGSGADGLRINIPTKNVVAKNCRILSSHGGIAIGSETAGGIENVQVSDCHFEGTQRAIRLKSRRGRGGVIQNITLNNLHMDKCWCPVVIGQYFAPGVLPDERDSVLSEMPQPITEMTPQIRNIQINNIVATDIRSTAAFIVGLPEAPIEHVTIKNYRYTLAPADQLLETHHTEPTEGHFHDDDRGIKIINARHVEVSAA